MSDNKSLTEETLQESLESQRLISKALRRTIKNPHKLCDWCMQEYVSQTPEGLMLCVECDREYVNELKTKMG